MKILLYYYHSKPRLGCSLKTVWEREVSLSGEKWMSAAKCVCESYVCDRWMDGWMDTVVERDEY